jgi:hypothetical protein
MTIELKPEQERILQEALRQGRFHSMEVALDRAIQSIAPQENAPKRIARPPGKKSLVQLFAESPLKGLDLNFERAKDTGRTVEL